MFCSYFMGFETNITFVIFQNTNETLRSQQHFQAFKWKFSKGMFMFLRISYSTVGRQIGK